MRKKQKKTYHKPELQEVLLDQTILLQQVSATEEGPPTDPFGIASSNSEASGESSSIEEDLLKQNNFDDNPFQR